MSWEPTSEGFGEAQAAHTAPAVSEEQQRAAYRDYQWASNRARYEYNENAVDENGMAPRNESLEKELFDNEQQGAIDFSKYEKIPVKVERGAAPPPIRNFDEADLHPVMKENVRLARYTNPTPVQTYSIPIVTSGKDLMACAQTGSGKTAAFLVPTLSALFGRAKELAKPRPAPYETRSYKAEPLVLIIAPTRELCSQIFDECRKFTYRSSLRPCAVYGGADTLGQLRQLERGCDVLAAAPGRLMDFIDRGKIGLGRVKYLVLDEADRMLDMGFESIIRAIVQKKGMNPEHQTLLYSATFPRAIRALARDFLRADYLFLKVGRVGGTSTSITQRVIYVPEDQKREELRNLLNGLPPSRTLIFVETKRSADSLDQFLYERNFPSTSIHGDRTQMEREDALLAFKSGKCPLLVATAVAARGIDIRNVMHVVNYDMPNDMDEYIHRIGRTARVGKTGLATSFYNERSEHLASDLTKLLKECQQEIPEFLQSYVTDDMTFDEDLDDTQVEAPTYAGREYVPMERNIPGAPQGFNNAEGTGAADGAWAEDSYGGGGNNGARAGDWNCSACSASNYARRTECFKCNEPRPEGAGGGFGGERRPPRARRDGDWDCSGCGAVNFASRNECFKCQAPKQGGDGGFGEYNGDSNYGNYDQPADTGASTFDSANWDSSAAAAGWGGSGDNNAPAASGGWDEPATAASGGWGEPAPAAPAAAPAAAPTASAASAASGGWGEPAAAPAASGGWGEPAPAAPAAAPAAPATSGGWGEPAPAAPAAAPAAAPTASAASGGWGEPAAAPAASGGWGEPAPAAPAAAPATSGGWNAPASAPAPAPAAAPANDGWGSAPAQTSGDGWGSAPAHTNGFGW